MLLRVNLRTGEQELVIERTAVPVMRVEAPNDPVYREAVELLNQGKRREAKRRLGYKLMVRCLANGWYRELDYCELCLVKQVCKVRDREALRWLLRKAFQERVNNKQSLLTRAAEGLADLARRSPDVARALEEAARGLSREEQMGAQTR